MKKVLTIAGSDCSGGAGIQADIKTIMAHKMYGMSVITALTAQNTTGVYGVYAPPAEFTGKQIDCVFTDIIPDAVKIGMISNEEVSGIIAERLAYYEAKNVVLDTVMVSTSGSNLINGYADDIFNKRLLETADIITPNIPEAECFCGFAIRSPEDMVKAAEYIFKNVFSGDILIKGGHLSGSADDLLYRNGRAVWFKSERVDNENTHGTGCTLSSAIACGLADGKSIEESVLSAKNYVYSALKAKLDLGKGKGPLNHCV